MGRKKTTDQWISEAIEIWGNQFDYSYSVYNGRSKPITIICPNCGPISVVAGNHISKQPTRKPAGCDACNRKKVAESLLKPFEQMRSEANLIHNNRYEYLRNSYQGSRTKMEVVCPIHGKFLITPDSHINRKSGCKKCSDLKAAKDTLAQRFSDTQSKISELSHNTVLMQFETYKGQNHIAELICTTHGTYKRKPIQALQSRHPCIDCMRLLPKDNTKITDDIIRKRVHSLKGRVKIHSIDGVGTFAPISISCLENPNHNPLNTTSIDTLYRANYACHKCGSEAGQPARTEGLNKALKKTLAKRKSVWLKEANKYHEKKYDYKLVDYRGAHEKVIIICPIHGAFSQTAGTHLTAGCRLCANENLKGRYTNTYFERYPEEKNKPAILYHVKFDALGLCFYKVGITVNSIKERFAVATGTGFTHEVIKSKELPLYEAFLAEQKILKSVSKTIQTELTEEQCEHLRVARIGITELVDSSLANSLLNEHF